MYSIMIVEDEKIEREFLQKMVLEEFPQIHDVFSFGNGYDAIEHFRNHACDIALIDINIPGVDGLEVIHQIKELNKQVLCYVLTSYSSFEYAVKSVKLGVEDYLMKPITKKELSLVLNSAMLHIKNYQSEQVYRSSLVNKVEKLTPKVEQDCILSVISNADKEELLYTFSLLNRTISGGICVLLDKDKIDDIHINKIWKELHIFSIYYISYDTQNLYVIFLLVTTQEDELFLNDCKDRLMSVFAHDGIGVGGLRSGIENLYESYNQALQNLNNDKRLEPKLVDGFNFKEVVANILTAFIKQDDSRINKEISYISLLLLPLDDRELFHYIMIFKKEVCQQFYQHFDGFIPAVNLSESLNFNKQNKLMELRFYLNEFMKSITDIIKDQRNTNKNMLIKKAMEYIESNFMKPISLNDLSEHLNVSSFYISKLLNSSGEYSFTDLVTSYRIEEAKKLLKTNVSIKSISFSIGFHSSTYFGRIFKKYVGVTPKEYRMHYMGIEEI